MSSPELMALLAEIERRTKAQLPAADRLCEAEAVYNELYKAYDEERSAIGTLRQRATKLFAQEQLPSHLPFIARRE